MNVLLVEDDAKMAGILREALHDEGIAVTCAYDGRAGAHLALYQSFDLLILDVMLPGMDGFQIGTLLRERRVKTPILYLTARDAETDMIQGLDLGGDDYLIKPFSFKVLLSRIRALGRRREQDSLERLVVEDLVLLPASREAYRQEKPLDLTKTEFDLLWLLMRRTNQVVRREALIEAGWGTSLTVGSNNLDVFMRQLRLKVDKQRPVGLIHTVRGIGYRLTRQ